MNTKKQDEHTSSHTHPTPSPRGRDGEGLRQGILFLSLLLLLLCTGAKPLRAQTAQVTRTWLEHGVTQNGEQGMMVHVEFDVQGMKGVSGKAVAFIDSPKGTGWKDTNGQYCTNTGNVCASTIFKPSYDNSHYSDLNIFFPYGELHLAPGKKEYFCTVYIHDSNKYIAHGEFVSFTGTGSSGNTPAPQQQAGSRRAAFPNGQTLYFANEADRRVFWMEFSYDNEGDAICVWPMRMPATRFVLKSRDSQGFHFKEYTFGMEMQTTSTLFGNITGPTGRMVKQERNQEFVLANDLGCIYMFGLRYEAVSKQEYSRIFQKSTEDIPEATAAARPSARAGMTPTPDAAPSATGRASIAAGRDDAPSAKVPAPYTASTGANTSPAPHAREADAASTATARGNNGRTDANKAAQKRSHVVSHAPL